MTDDPIPQTVTRSTTHLTDGQDAFGLDVEASTGAAPIRANLSLTHRIEVSVYEGAPEAALSMHANPGANRPD